MTMFGFSRHACQPRHEHGQGMQKKQDFDAFGSARQAVFEGLPVAM